MLASPLVVARAAVQHHYVDVLIVGGGLSGLMVAHELEKLRQQQQQHQQQQHQNNHSSWNYTLVEARSVLGGRLANDGKHDDIDLGGAWFWPPDQELVTQLVQELGIPTVEQPPINPYMSTKRLQGGAVQLVRQLAKRIPQERLWLNTPVTICRQEPPIPQKEQNDQCDTATTMKIRVETTTTTTNDNDDNDDNHTTPKETTTTTTTTLFWANHVIFCVPPKLLATHVTFDPPLSQAKQLAMQQSNTWMAGVTKVALVYETAFWKDDYQFQNILGRLAGPAFQMYDSSTDHVAALTAFCVAPTNNNDNDDNDDDKKLADQVAGQLGQAFQYLRSPELVKHATAYTEYHIQRWPLEKYISEDPNPTTIRPHPYPVKALSAMEWNGKLLFAGSETDVHSPGVMEGAIGSALRCIQQLSDQRG